MSVELHCKLNCNSRYNSSCNSSCTLSCNSRCNYFLRNIRVIFAFFNSRRVRRRGCEFGRDGEISGVISEIFQIDLY